MRAYVPASGPTIIHEEALNGAPGWAAEQGAVCA